MKFINLREKYAGFGIMYIKISETGEKLNIDVGEGNRHDEIEDSLAKVFADYPNIKRLQLEAARLQNLSVLEPLRNLRELVIYAGVGGYGDWSLSASINDVSSLGKLPKLDSLAIVFSGGDLSTFAELKQIRSLHLRVDEVNPDLDPIGKLSQLENLSLSVKSKRFTSTRIDSIAQIEGLVNLKSLKVSSIGIKSIAPVKGMLLLECLDCSNNYIRSIKPLAKLSELRELDASHNKSLRDVSVLNKLNKLEKLDLAGTASDFPPHVTLVKKDGFWGVIGSREEIVIDFKWDDITWFKHDDKYGYIVCKKDEDRIIRIPLDADGNVITEERSALLPSFFPKAELARFGGDDSMHRGGRLEKVKNLSYE